jgi:hypothetical protein
MKEVELQIGVSREKKGEHAVSCTRYPRWCSLVMVQRKVQYVLWLAKFESVIEG